MWVFEDERPDERLVLFAVDLLLKVDRPADAEAHLWRAFRKAPSMSLFGRLRHLGGKAAARRAIELLETRLAEQRPAPRYFAPDLVVRIMIEEKMFEAAWKAAREYHASQNMRERLAKASEATCPSEALAVYEERVEELARVGGGPAYQEAAALITRMGGLRGAAEQATYLAAIKSLYARRRNFMKLLE